MALVPFTKPFPMHSGQPLLLDADHVSHGAGMGTRITDNAWMNGHRCPTSHLLAREGHKALQGSGAPQGMLQCLCARLVGFT